MSMFATPSGRADAGRMASSPPEATNYFDEYTELKGTGWVLFSAMILGLAGFWAALEGALALSSSKVYVADANYVFSDLRTWGWIMLIVGIASVIASFALFAGSQLARWFAVAVAGVNAISQLMFFDANPWWGAAMFTVDLLIVYGLIVYGHTRRRIE